MNKYLKSILLYSIFIPLLGIGIPVVLVLVGIGKFDEVRTARFAAYAEQQERVQQVAQLKKEIDPKVDEIAAIQNLINGDLQASLDKTLTNAEHTITIDSLERTLRDFPADEPSVDAAVSAASQKLVLHYVGRFEPMEQAALALETNAPNLFLETLEIQRGEESAMQQFNGKHLEFDLSYAAWKE